jgi:hypothetical protein
MMAKGDTKYTRRRGGGSYSTYTYNPDADYRAASKRYYDAVMSFNDPVTFITTMGDSELLNAYNAMRRISRYGQYDWHRVSKHISKRDMEVIMQRIENAKAEKQAANKVRQEEYDKQRDEAEAKRRAELEEQTMAFRKAVSLTAGMLSSDFHQAFALKEAYGRDDGDWLDDPVAAYTGQAGFGEEVKVQSGIKMQVTVSLDMSNSMWNNAIADSAIRAFIEIGLALEDIQAQYPGSFYTAAFLFAMGDNGKQACRVREQRWSNTPEELRLGNFEGMRHNLSWMPSNAGQDTWMTPLFEQILKWEEEESDDGCVRLDIVLTDAVLEHPTDIRKSSEVQERRNGALQTVFLNFLSEEQWYDSRLPMRCVQYPADANNVGGLLRQVLSNFVSVYI